MRSGDCRCCERLQPRTHRFGAMLLSSSTLMAAAICEECPPVERLAAFLSDSAAASRPAPDSLAVPEMDGVHSALDWGREEGDRAGVDAIEEELRHLELDLVEAIEQTKENVEELYFWRFVYVFGREPTKIYACACKMCAHCMRDFHSPKYHPPSPMFSSSPGLAHPRKFLKNAAS